MIFRDWNIVGRLASWLVGLVAGGSRMKKAL